MHYVGGKQKSGGHHIATEIRRFAAMTQTTEIVEPCCGGLSVTSRLQGLDVVVRDVCPSLIVLYQAMQAGWMPPAEVGRETWEHYKASPDPEDPMTAFVGFGCSRFGGWFSSFIVDYKYTKRIVPAATAARDSLLKKLDKCRAVEFSAGDYADAPRRGVWYCDIPYADSFGYAAVGPFDHARFWSLAEDVSRERPVLVSERVAPENFRVVREWSLQNRMNAGSNTRRMERLFVHERWA
jgi:hypothetical protein